MENQDVKLIIDNTTFVLRLGKRFLDYCEYWNTARHCNANYELHIILKGSCELDVASRTHLLTEGNAILIAPNEYHMRSRILSSVSPSPSPFQSIICPKPCGRPFPPVSFSL